MFIGPCHSLDLIRCAPDQVRNSEAKLEGHSMGGASTVIITIPLSIRALILGTDDANCAK
jgi:hypothetical protein